MTELEKAIERAEMPHSTDNKPDEKKKPEKTKAERKEDWDMRWRRTSYMGSGMTFNGQNF